MPTEYAEASFSACAYARFQVFGISIHSTIDFWPYTVIFKAYYAPIHPLTRALPEHVSDESAS